MKCALQSNQLQWQGFLLTSTDRLLDQCLAHNRRLKQAQSNALAFSGGLHAESGAGMRGITHVLGMMH